MSAKPVDPLRRMRDVAASITDWTMADLRAEERVAAQRVRYVTEMLDKWRANPESARYRAFQKVKSCESVVLKMVRVELGRRDCE